MKTRRVLKSATTYLDIDTKPTPMDSDVELRNHQAPMDLLIDPQEDFDRIDTHFPIVASKKAKILADMIPEELQDEEQEDEVVDEAEVDASAKRAKIRLAAKKKVVKAEAEEEKPEAVEDETLVDIAEEPDLEDSEEVEANEEAADNAAEMLSPESADEVIAELEVDVPADIPAEPGPAEPEPVEMPDQGQASEIDIDAPVDVVDIEAMSDDEIDDVEFIESPDETVLALKANRIIATLTKRAAIAASIDSVYNTDRFEAATRLEMSKNGLRKGLINAGFKLSSYKIKASNALALKLKASTKSIVASAEKAKADERTKMIQATAIACTGLNRGMYKGFKNELRDELVTNLRQAGLVNADRVVQAAFKAKGVDYLKSVLALANKIQAMPEEIRDGMAEELDITEEPEVLESENCEACDQFGAPIMAEEEIVIDENPLPETVTAAVSKPIRQLKASAGVDEIKQLLKSREAAKPFGLY